VVFADRPDRPRAQPPNQSPEMMRALQAPAVHTPMVVTECPAPMITAPGDVVVRVHYAALNPVDWKMLDYGFMVSSWPAFLGGDVAGVIEEVGEEAAKKFKVGDRVWGFAEMGKMGSFAELVRMTRVDIIGRVPNHMDLKDAATLPIGLLTAGIMLYVESGPVITGPENSVLVYGASSSVGLYCVQLAALAGHKVVAIASPHNKEMVTKLGATTFIDYHDADWEAQAIAALGPASKAVALDSISSIETAAACARVIKATGGTSVALTLQEASTVEGVVYKPVFLGGAYTNEKVGEAVAGFLPKLDALLAAKSLVPNPVQLLGGLEKVNEGFAMMRANKVSGLKLVVQCSA